MSFSVTDGSFSQEEFYLSKFDPNPAANEFTVSSNCVSSDSAFAVSPAWFNARHSRSKVIC
jgi:hypothetical protein